MLHAIFVGVCVCVFLCYLFDLNIIQFVHADINIGPILTSPRARY